MSHRNTNPDLVDITMGIFGCIIILGLLIKWGTQ